MVGKDSGCVRVEFGLPRHLHADTFGGEVEPSDPGEQGTDLHHISSTRTATPGRRPYDFDAWSSTTVESSAITSPVNASRTARASLSTSGRPGHFGADSLIFWALRPVPKWLLGRDR